LKPKSDDDNKEDQGARQESSSSASSNRSKSAASTKPQPHVQKLLLPQQQQQQQQPQQPLPQLHQFPPLFNVNALNSYTVPFPRPPVNNSNNNSANNGPFPQSDAPWLFPSSIFSVPMPLENGAFPPRAVRLKTRLFHSHFSLTVDAYLAGQHPFCSVLSRAGPRDFSQYVFST